MKKSSLFKSLLIEIIFFCKGILGRFYFDKVNRRIFSITPSLCNNPIKKEIYLLWGKWAFVFWYGKYFN